MDHWDRARRYSYQRQWPEPPRSLWGEFCDIVVTWVGMGIAFLMIGFVGLAIAAMAMFSILAAIAPYAFALVAMLWIFGLL